MAPGHKHSGIGSFGLERVMEGLLSWGFAGTRLSCDRLGLARDARFACG
jgi:hypothetical protein